MSNVLFVTGLAGLLIGILTWGVRTLPAERWQMIAAVPLSKDEHGGWHGLNLTYYGLFSATASTFGTALTIVLLGSVGTPMLAAAAVIGTMLAICVPASKVLAWVIEGKRNTFTIAGAAFLASVIMPPGLLAAQWLLMMELGILIYVMPTLAAAAIAYAFSEALGRMACLSFGCCYGKPVREAGPRLSRLFGRFPLVFHGNTKKVAYASGMANQPLVPVQTITAIVFTAAGLIGLAFFLTGHFRLAAIIPAVATWGWRALSELLRADHRGYSRISVYQLMALIAIAYLVAAITLLPGNGPTPNVMAGLSLFASVGVIVLLEALWVGLFLFYGRSRVTGSIMSFHVVTERV
jgi:hypothetical protein